MYIEMTIGEVSAKLRAIRLSKSLSLNDVERISNGTLKAVVLGSYERGARSLSVKRALHICQIYEIPINHLFGDRSQSNAGNTKRLVLDLRRLNRQSQDSENLHVQRYQYLSRLVRNVLHSRQDWNGEVLSIRHSDCMLIALMADLNEKEVMQWLEEERILLRHK
jgi:transcriptional regulator with XRE-family HTH domain